MHAPPRCSTTIMIRSRSISTTTSIQTAISAATLVATAPDRLHHHDFGADLHALIKVDVPRRGLSMVDGSTERRAMRVSSILMQYSPSPGGGSRQNRPAQSRRTRQQGPAQPDRMHARPQTPSPEARPTASAEKALQGGPSAAHSRMRQTAPTGRRRGESP